MSGYGVAALGTRPLRDLGFGGQVMGLDGKAAPVDVGKPGRR
jgi:hypothetical protein